jgi:hypothetical protein
MTRKLTLTLFITLLGFSATVSRAHHSFAAEFDVNTKISVEGVIVEVRYRNPHVQYFIETGDDERWNVQAQNVPSLRRLGWNKDTLKIGDTITVNGFAGRDGALKVYVESIVTPSGEVLAMHETTGETAVDASEVRSVASVSLSDSNIADDLLGHWGFDIDKTLPGAPFHLEFFRDGESISAVLDNEVLDVIVGRDEFEIELNRENFAGFPAKLQLIGAISNGDIHGSVSLLSGYTNVPSLDASTFKARRSNPDHWDHSTPAAMRPVDLTGIWTRTIALGSLGRTNPHLNSAGLARHAEFQMGLYDPTLRCMSSGVMRRYAEPGLVEFVASTNRLTILYANGSEIRRVFFDRERHSTTRRHDALGESIGSWDGSTLVIDTSNLTETVLTHNSEPISNNARIIERYWLEDDGEMVMEATLHDPTYYERPVVRRTQWKRADDEEMLYAPCDPDSFFRGMQLEGTLDGYFENQPDRGQE